MEIIRIASTIMDAAAAQDATDGEWLGEFTIPGKQWDDGGSQLAEFAGRSCYQSWDRPNPLTADTTGYINNILRQQHFSVLEHGSVTYAVRGVSRSLTHELVRHRHLSYSQLSQRFVTVQPTEHDADSMPYVIPPLYAGSSRANSVLSAAWDYAVHAYENLIQEGNRIIGDVELVRGQSAAKVVREAARAVLPNMTPTAIVVTGNHRAWREFLEKRGSMHADAEIRKMALEVWMDLISDDNTRDMYADFQIRPSDDADVVWLERVTK